MARKRGGLAGIYDRNKKLIKTVAPIAAGFIPGVGPAIGAALGAAMGADREGKGYFKGFDAGGAVMGGLSGYGGAKLGQAAKGGLGKLFTAGVSPVDKLTGAPKLGVLTQTTGQTGAVQGLAGAPSVGLTAGAPSSYGAIGSFQPTMAGGAGGSAAAAAAPSAASSGSVYGNIPAPTMGKMPNIATQMADKPLGRLAQAGKFAKDNKDLIAMAGKGVQSLLPDAASDAAYMNAETARMRLEEEQNQAKMEQERRSRIAELLMPMFTQMSGGRGTPAMTMQSYLDSSGANATQEEFGPEMMNYINSRPTRSAGPTQARPSMSAGERYMESYGGTPQAQQLSANAAAAGRNYMTTGFGGSDRAKQLAAEAIARGRNYTYGRR